ncbi:flagellar protein FlaG [Dethiobacter alkaliphilus]|uniref:flagellar protein FlaG n=1 Tax=Dethiobacter alkaliphilus TaxID=427926 RepID=UPI0022269DE0|nr:flagellar protein FlaG [Dethiobacter alkaliphilus]MCW3488753.1 flagellar protein FlaG [Dethiobacter alkaliphilus]
MRVQGVDPIILNRIQEKVKKHTVQQSEQAYISNEQGRQKKEQQREAADSDKMAAAVKKLNSTAEALGIDLLFFWDEEAWVVLVMEKKTQQIIRELEPDKINEMLVDMQSFVGIMVDYVL